MPLGDFKQEEFTKEELAALGETTEPDNGKEKEPDNPEQPEKKDEPETKETPEQKEAETEEKKDEEKKEDEPQEPTPEAKEQVEKEGAKIIEEHGKKYIVYPDGAKMRLSRFEKIWAEKRAGEEAINKFNLFKQLGADEYYQRYPEEKPADYKPPEPQKPETTERKVEDYSQLVVQDGDYKGWTLEQVAKENPTHAFQMFENYRAGIQAKEDETRRKQEQSGKEFEKERETFCQSIAKELYGNADVTDDPVKAKTVKNKYYELSDWMKANNKTGYALPDAYFLMNKEKILEKERSAAAKKAIETVTKPGIKSIGNGGEGAEPTGFEAYLTMTEDKLMSVIDGFSDKAQQEFYKNAPKALRDKYPSLPW